MSVLTPGPAQFDTLREIAFGSITGSFQLVGTAFGHINYLIKIQNTCNTGMFISFDGTNIHDYIPSNGFSLYDFNSNALAQPFGEGCYVKYESAPSSGNVYVTTVHFRGS
jgi:hypothetical protein